MAGKSRLKLIAVIVVVIVIASGAVVFFSVLSNKSAPRPSPQPVIVFISPSVLNSTYDEGFKMMNYTNDTASAFSSLGNGLVNVRMELYGTNNNTYSNANVIAIMIMELNSTAEMKLVLNNITSHIFPNSTLVSTGNYSGFAFSELNVSVSANTIGMTAIGIIAHYRNFILFMEFMGNTQNHSTTIFHDQVNAMFPVS